MYESPLVDVSPFVTPLVPIFHLVQTAEPKKGPPFASSFEVRVFKVWNQVLRECPIGGRGRRVVGHYHRLGHLFKTLALPFTINCWLTLVIHTDLLAP